MSNEVAIVPVPKVMTHYAPEDTMELALVSNAAHNIKLARKSKLTETELVDLLRLLAEGATERKIINYFCKTHNRVISQHTIISYRRKYMGRIVEIAQNMELVAVETGLTKRSNRLRKLQELAEALETEIFTIEGNITERVSAKMIGEYRAVLSQIAQETGDVSTQTIGDVAFINMSNDELKALFVKKIQGNRDLAVQFAETAGIRPGIQEEIDGKIE